MDIPADIERMAHHLLKLADKADGMIVTAESCTGGQLSAVLTSAEGWSHCFDRGFVSYTETAKQELLGVPSDLIASNGVVSRSVAVAMAEGGLARSDALCALAVTGFAGPAEDGDEPGLVHVACAIRDHGVGHRELHFGETDRDQIRWDSIRALLDLARNQLVASGIVASETN